MNALVSEGLTLLKESEKLHLTPYYDVNGWAIGYGMHYYSNGSIVKQTDKITKAFAESEFKKVVSSFGSQVSKLLTKKVNDYQFTALVSYSYNRGIGAFRGSTLLKMVNKNPNDSAIPAQFVKEWGTNNTYKNGLITRRKTEAALYVKGSGVNGNVQVFLTVLSTVAIAYFVYIKFIKA